ncbi:MAG: type II secretion system secretin GspD [Lentisphaerae bacterium]|nr:type II secretion system secretin GspD [Lentisphaerota bacterium]
MKVRVCMAIAIGVAWAATPLLPPRAWSEDATNPAARLQARLPEIPEHEATINFSFDQVAIPTFARLVGELTGRKIVVADNVQGKVTVISPKIPRSEAYSLFVSILESAGCSVIQDGDIDRVVALAERATPMAPVVGVDEVAPQDGLVTKVFRLKHASAGEVRKILEPKVSGGRTGAVGVIEETNHLVVTDTAESIRRIEKIVAEIDQPGLSRMTEIVPLQFAAAEEVARELNDTMSESTDRGEQLKRRLPSAAESPQEANRHALVVASPHANSLLLVGTASQIEELKTIIGKMDIDAPSGRGRLNAIFLKYIKAEDAAKNLKALLGRQDVPAAGQGSTPVVTPRRDIAIEPSPENNALLVDANPGDFEVVKKLVDQLDRVPEQVHIEVLIAELTEGDGFDLGVDMAALDLPGKVGDYAIQGSSTLKDKTESIMDNVQQGIFPGGLTVGVAHGTRIDSSGNVVVGYPGIISINAIKKDSRFKIRSNPSLMAQNNHEASVSIVNEIPVLTSTIQGGSGTSRDVIQNIERVDVGIKLKLTPHVIPGGEVRMELNPSIEAVLDPGSDSQQLTPTIAKREVSTTVTVNDGEVIVIAGLTREDQSKTVKRIPILGSIPLIGWLFRHTVEATEKTNLLIFVTPTIVRDSAVAARLRKRATDATGLNYHDDDKP